MRSPAGAQNVLTLDEARGWILENSFTTNIPGRVGVELELIADGDMYALPQSALPRGGRLTLEPGGQVEFSSRTCNSLRDAVEATAVDLAEVRRRSSDAGVELRGEGTHPTRVPRRQTDHPRYRAMEGYFDREGPHGRRMMRATAALQVTVESGSGVEGAARWRVLHAVGPALIAAFANSPFLGGRDTGWVSTRQAIWWALDEARTRPVQRWPSTADPADAFAHYALNAPIMMVVSDGASWEVGQRFTLADWVGGFGPAELRRPTLTDLQYHLTTLFPPVRPRGAVEVRYLDAQRGDGWLIPLAVLHALAEDVTLSDHLLEVTATTADRWEDAAELGLRDSELATAAAAVLEAAVDSLRWAGEPAWLVDRVAEFLDAYTRRRRCPADDLREVGPGRMPRFHPVLDGPVPLPIAARS